MTLDDDRRAVWDDLGSVLGAKYAPHVLFALDDGDRRFSELRREVGVAAATLTRRLRGLRCRGLVTRRVVPTSPPTTRYALTDAGVDVVTALSTIDDRAELVACGTERCAHLSPPSSSPCCE